jgi:hypothetical protein
MARLWSEKIGRNTSGQLYLWRSNYHAPKYADRICLDQSLHHRAMLFCLLVLECTSLPLTFHRCITPSSHRIDFHLLLNCAIAYPPTAYWPYQRLCWSIICDRHRQWSYRCSCWRSWFAICWEDLYFYRWRMSVTSSLYIVLSRTSSTV